PKRVYAVLTVGKAKCVLIACTTSATEASVLPPTLYVAPGAPCSNTVRTAVAQSATASQLRRCAPVSWTGIVRPSAKLRIALGINFSGYWLVPYTFEGRTTL